MLEIKVINCSIKYVKNLLLCTEKLFVSNTSLNYWVGTPGQSYMCRKEQTLNVTQDFSLNTFELQVQPFGVNGDFGSGTFFLYYTFLF